MMFQDFWEMVLNPVFLIMFGLVLAGFLPVALSALVTFLENSEQMEMEAEQE
jgi:hypothetical protein